MEQSIGQSLLPMDLFPVYPETYWERCLFEAIQLVQQNWLPFGYNVSCGCNVEDIHFRKNCFMKKTFSIQDNESVFEVFMIAWKKWMGPFFESDWDLSVFQMNELLRRCFFIESIDIYPDEFPKGLIYGLLKIPNWLVWFKDFNIKVEEIDDPRDLRFGDFCRIQNSENCRDGFTGIVIGDGWKNGKPVLFLWSSFPYYDRNWEYTFKFKPGQGCNYVYLRKNKGNFQRRFYGARLIDIPAVLYQFTDPPETS